MQNRISTPVLASQIAYDATKNCSTAIHFDPESLVMKDEKTFRQHALTAAHYLTAPVAYDEYCIEDDEFTVLDCEVFTSERSGEYIADVTICTGGQTVTARYESRNGYIVLEAHWGGNNVQFTANDCPLIDWIKCYMNN